LNRFIDGAPIHSDVRVAAYRLQGASVEEAERYRWQLALNASCTLGFSRQHHPSAVAIGNQYDPASITALRRTAKCNLASLSVDLGAFVALEQLNLAYNRLTSMSALALDALPSLRHVELHNNDLRQPLQEIASVIDRCTRLDTITLRNNANMRGSADRHRLLGLLRRVREPACALRLIDTPITVAERLAAAQRYGGLQPVCAVVVQV
jgi:hypothetical protein